MWREVGSLGRLSAGMGCGLGLLALGLGAVSAQDNGTPKEPDEFVTEIRLAVDRSKSDPRHLKGVNLKKVEAVLQRRLAIFGSTGGSAAVKSLEDLRMVVPTVKIDDLQLRLLCREGRVEVRHLDNIRTSQNPEAPYGLDRRIVQGESTFLFRDLRNASIVPPEVFLKRCPLVIDSDDLDPDIKPDEAGASGGFRLPLTQSGAKRMRNLARRGGSVVAVVLDGELQGIRVLNLPAAPKRQKAEKKKPGPGATPEPAGSTGEPVEDLGSYVDLAPAVSGPDEAGYLAVVLSSGALPGPLRVLSQKVNNRRSVAMAPLDKHHN